MRFGNDCLAVSWGISVLSIIWSGTSFLVIKKLWRLQNMLDICWPEVHFPWIPLAQMIVWCFSLPFTALNHLPERLLTVYLETALLPCCLCYELFLLWLNWIRINAVYFLCVFEKRRHSWWAESIFSYDITFVCLFFSSHLEKIAGAVVPVST